MKKISLLIMAAGIGSRFGGGIKQLEPVGLHDEIIMDYSIHDAIEAGFLKIIFVMSNATPGNTTLDKNESKLMSAKNWNIISVPSQAAGYQSFRN